MRQIVRTVVCGLAALVIFGAAPASAQYQRYRPASGASAESWHVEFTFGTWQPAPDLTVTDTSGGLAGTAIDAKNDLGVQSKLLEQYTLVLRPAKKHKFRFGYAPATYTANVNLERSVLFNGQTYTISTPVATSINWTTYRFGYEYDFISRSRGFVGVILEGRYDKASVALSSPQVTEEAKVRTPVPLIGGIVQVYPATILSLTAEIAGFSVPGRITRSTNYGGDWLDLDLYATVNIGRYLGLRSGYRSSTITYMWDANHAHAVWKGPYASVVVRF